MRLNHWLSSICCALAVTISGCADTTNTAVKDPERPATAGGDVDLGEAGEAEDTDLAVVTEPGEGMVDVETGSMTGEGGSMTVEGGSITAPSLGVPDGLEKMGADLEAAAEKAGDKMGSAVEELEADAKAAGAEAGAKLEKLGEDLEAGAEKAGNELKNAAGKAGNDLKNAID